MKKKMMTIWLMVVVLISGNTLAALEGYTVSGGTNSVVYYTNFDSGVQTPLGGPTGIYNIVALEYSSVDHVLYAGSRNDLYSIDTTSGLALLVMEDITDSYIYAMDSDPDGALYVITESDELYKIDPVTLTVTFIEFLNPYIDTRAFSISPEGKAIAYDNGSLWLYEINLVDGSTTSIGALAGDFFEFDYAPDGELYGWRSTQFYRIDVENLQVTNLIGFSINCNSFTFVPLPDAPIADAGDDQTVTDTDNDGFEEVTLDGSGSYDSDGTIVSWVWTDNLGNPILDGEIVTVSLSVGIHTITLTVTDNDGLTDTDDVIITVEGGPTEPPIADAGEDINASANEEVMLDASGSNDPDGDIIQYTWTRQPDDTVLYSGGESTYNTRALGRAEEVIKLTVMDDRGATAEDAVSIVNTRLSVIPQLQEELAAMQADIDTLEQQLAALQVEITSLQQQLSALEQQTAEHEQQLAALEQQLEAVQVIVNENREAMEQFTPLQKLLEELALTLQEELQ